MSATLTTKDVRMGDFGAVRLGDSTTVERDEHRAGVLQALTGYCGQRSGRRGYHWGLTVNRGVLQRFKRRRKGRKMGVKRQVGDKLDVKAALLTPEQGKQTDNVSVRG